MKKLVFGLLALVLVTVSLFAACSSNSNSISSTTTSSSPVSTTQNQGTTIESQTTINLTNQPVKTTGSVTTITPQTKWWEKFGTPQYGGEITVPIDAMSVKFDPLSFGPANYALCYEPLFYSDWTVDRNEFAAPGGFVPQQYVVGNLAESWEMTDQQTMTIHLRRGVTWQNKAPVNGREFTADDVVFHFDRFLGKGHGYTKASAYAAMMAANWESVTATDKYTVVIHFKNLCGGVAFFSVSDPIALFWFEAKEWVALGGSPSAFNDVALTEWQNVVGTGPWILSDYAAGSYMTYSKNTTYWGYDPRYPQNQVPYADTLTIVCIPDTSTRVAALRSGKVDIMTAVSWQHAESMTGTDLQKAIVALNVAKGAAYRLDKAPFNDIRVRKALDMAINRSEIAESLYHGMTDGKPCGVVSRVYKGYCYPYDEWPKSLKDEYAYNPTKAKELLAEAGYPDGFSTNVIISNSDEMSQLMQIFKAYFSEIGVDIEIKRMDTPVMSSFVRSGKHDAMSESSAGQDVSPTRAIEQFYSKGPDCVQLGLNEIPDTVYDEIRNRFWSSTTPEEASQTLVEADKYSIEQHYGIFVSGANGYNCWQPYLKGYSNESITAWSRQILLSRLWVDSTLKSSLGR